MSTLSIILLILVAILGIKLYNSNQTVNYLATANGELEYEASSLKRENIDLLVDLSKLKLLQKADEVKIKLAWQYLYYLAKQEYLDEFISEIKEEFDYYLSKMKQANRASRSNLEVSPIDCTRHLHGIIDHFTSYKQELLLLDEA